MIRIPIQSISKEDLEKRYQKVLPIYEGLLDQLYHQVQGLMNQAGIKVTIRKRIKSFDSIFAKILKKGRLVKLYSHFEGIEPSVILTDFLGIRIICPFLEDTIVVEDIIRRNLEVIEQEYKGEEYSPHEFGYISTHVIVKIAEPLDLEGVAQEEILAEIQVRTFLQDAWAEVEHELMYKAEFTPFDEPLRRKLAAVNANLSLSDIIFQEIRDYQRKLQAELRIRRKNFNLKVHSMMEETTPLIATTSVSPPNPPPTHSKGSPFYETLDNLLLEALSAHNQQQYARAVELYSKILSRKPKKSVRALVFIHRGMAFFGESNYNRALEDFTAAIALEPENPRIYYFRGIVQRFRKDLNGALLDFNRSLELDPYHFDSMFSRAQVYFNLGNYVQAADNCKGALSLRPKAIEARRFLEVIEKRIGF